MTHKPYYSFVFAAVLCFISGILLTFAANGLKPYQDRNAAMDEDKNILKALGLWQAHEILTAKIFSERFRQVHKKELTTDGRLVDSKQPGSVPIYLLYDAGGQVAKYAFPVSGSGLWGTIYGYAALEKDGKTIAGITFYKHSETPGLGAEVEKDWFASNFKGKQIVTAQGEFVSVRVAKGNIKNVIAPDQQIHYVDGISGSTLTGNGINTFLARDFKTYEVFSLTLRRKKS